MSPRGELPPYASLQVIFISIRSKEWELDSKREYKPFAYLKSAKHMFLEV